jgi:hypothetical protein
MSSQKSITTRIREINNELGALERERVGLVGLYRANRRTEIRNGKRPDRDIGLLRPNEQADADRNESILLSNLALDAQARRQGLMTA